MRAPVGRTAPQLARWRWLYAHTSEILEESSGALPLTSGDLW